MCCGKKRDESGLVVAFEYDGKWIGTLRALPMHGCIAPCEELIRQHGGAPAPLLEGAWEVGRVVLDTAYRAGPGIIRRCLFLTLTRLLQERSARQFFASCSPLLARLYRRFGFSVLVRDFCPAEDGFYSLIHGRVDDVLFALAESDADRALAAHLLAGAGTGRRLS